MLFCLAYSTAIELFATQELHLYRYTLSNVPLYVPFGHGLIFLACLQFSRTPLIVRHEKLFVRAVLAVATCWCVSGLLSTPRDIHGAMYWPFYAAFALLSAEAPVYAATFLVTSYIELVGVRLGTWHWAPVFPYLGVTSGDPPSLIAGGYCSFAVVAVQLDRLLVRSQRREPAR
jgi:hypothetical protein